MEKGDKKVSYVRHRTAGRETGKYQLTTMEAL
jgi:hypothetical protein